MEPIHDFLAMGGYGAYVWPAYALAALVLVVLLVASLRQLRAGQSQLRRLGAELPGRRGSRRPAAAAGDANEEPAP